MDSIKGAIILRELLAKEPQPEIAVSTAFVPSDAPPIFHWLGVAPEQPTGAD